MKDESGPGSIDVTPYPWAPATDKTKYWDSWLGSWTQTVKKYGKTGAETDWAWDQDDIPSTLEALQATGQNVLVYTIDTESDWDDFLILLEASKGTHLKIFAMMQSPNTNSDETRWFGHDGSPAKGDETNDCEEWEWQRELSLDWLDAWKQAAELLSALSLSYENLVGFTIDDFADVESADTPSWLYGKKLTKTEVQSIRDACHKHNPDFGFYPLFSFDQLGRFVGRGFILGKNYGVTLRKDEAMSVTLSFTLAAGHIAAFPTFLRFFHSGGRDSDNAMQCAVLVNKVEIGSMEKLSSYTSPQYASFEIPSLTVGKKHRIEFKLYAKSVDDYGVKDSFWRIWGVTLRDFGFTGKELEVRDVSYEVSFATVSAADLGVAPSAYEAEDNGMFISKLANIDNEDDRLPSTCEAAQAQLDAAAVADSASTGYLLKRLVAAPNDAYLIHDVVDGIIPYTASTDSSGETDALDPSLHYATLLRSLVDELSPKWVLPMHWSLDYGTATVDPDVLLARLETARETTKGALLWNYPLGVQFMNAPDRRGLFAESKVLDSWAGDYRFMAQWPGRQHGLRGWYQRWRYSGGIDGKELRIAVWDNQPVSTDVDDADTLVGNFSKRVYDTKSYYDVDPFTDGETRESVPSTAEGIVLGAAKPLVFGMEHSLDKDGVSICVRSCWDLTSILGGAPWFYFTFESGVTDAGIGTVFEKVRDYFLGIRATEEWKGKFDEMTEPALPGGPEIPHP